MSDMSEQEQWEVVKAWWKENGRMIIIVVIVVTAATFAYKYWQSSQRQQSQTASILYDQVLNNVFSQTELTTLATRLTSDYPKTPYASDAALFEAKNAVNNGDFASAQKNLNWVMEHAKDGNIRQVARIRSARLLLEQKQFDKALTLLGTIENDTYMPAINLVMGDIYLAQGNKTLAKKAYLDAFNALPVTQPIRQYLQMQIDELSS